MTKTELQEKLAGLRGWTAPTVPEVIPQGDMPGDKVQIGLSHISKAMTIFPLLLREMEAAAKENEKIVISVFATLSYHLLTSTAVADVYISLIARAVRKKMNEFSGVYMWRLYLAIICKSTVA